MTTKTLITIPLRDKVRNAVAGLTVYHDSKGHAFCAVTEALANHGYVLACESVGQILDFHGRDGRMVLDICKDGDDCASDLVFSWFTMCTGRIELTTYIS